MRVILDWIDLGLTLFDGYCSEKNIQESLCQDVNF